MRRRPATLAALVTALGLAGALGCAEPHWHAVRWPDEHAPAQPESESPAGISMRALAIEWEPEAIVVELELGNQGAPAVVERGAIMLVWDELEYPVAAPGRGAPTPPDTIELDEGGRASVRLRYHLGRPLTGPGAELIVRNTTRAGEPVVELPKLELPPMPAR